jgi:hypothetical protein
LPRDHPRRSLFSELTVQRSAHMLFRFACVAKRKIVCERCTR